jgi:hypothetical protein
MDDDQRQVRRRQADPHAGQRDVVNERRACRGYLRAMRSGTVHPLSGASH